jgi:starch-binding outer membrane protein, SusD/RagB family
MTRKTTHGALAALLLAVGAAGCDQFLTGPGLTESPNSPTQASRDQLFVAFQSAQFTQFEGALARTACIFMQQCAGVDRQYLSLGRYSFTEDDFSGEFTLVYVGGGLLDIRKVEASADAAHDSVYGAVARIWEAYVVGTAADIWGDIPYSEAVGGVAQPHLDPQANVYAAVQAKLDTALALLTGGGAGPGGVDLIYGGNKTKWTQAAHTLKARFHLHMAEVDPTRYASALAEARLGIAVSANDFKTYHSASTTEQNIWYQFQIVQRDSYLRAGKRLVDILKARSDPRLPVYYSQTTDPSLYGGKDPGQSADKTTSNICCPPGTSGSRLDPAFKQPLITHAETQLIIAEAAFQTGDPTTALDSLNAERVAAGLAALSGITGTALYDSIMTEKYVVTFQNIEAWNDYKRTCAPALVAYPTATFGNKIPGRLYYGFDERNTNPNIPTPPQQLATNGFRNANDPNPCP